MNSAIDFVQLRKLEKLRAKKERLQKKEQKKQKQQQQHDNRTHITTHTQIENCDSCCSGGKVHAESAWGDSLVVSLPPSLCCNASELCIEQYNISDIDENTSDSHCNQQQQQQLLLERPILLQNVYYIPQILSNEYMEYLSSWLHCLPHHDSNNTKSNTNKYKANDEKNYDGKWTRLKHAQRNVALFDLRQSTHNNDVKEIVNNTASPTTTPTACPNHTVLDNLCQLLLNINAFPLSHPPNHVLINEYQPSEGIMPHTDGPLYFHKTATFSIGGDVLFQFTRRLQQECDQRQQREHHSDDIVMQIMLSGKGSLIVFDDDAYINHCHSINDRIEPSEQDCVNSLHGSHDCGVSKESGNITEYIEYASEKCVNLNQGSVVKRGHRFSLTFRHKYL